MTPTTGKKNAWDKRRKNAAAEAKWRENPQCCCGCGAPLTKKGVKTQSKFKPGHDARLHSLVLKGEPIPEPAKAMKAYISFLQ